MIQTKDVTISDGPDAGKTFIVKQLPLLRGDRWANRVALALLGSGVDAAGLLTSDDDGRPAFVGLTDIAPVVNVALRALGGIDDSVAQSLLDEVIQDVALRLPGGGERPLSVEADISSIQTLWKLRIESIKVNLDFLAAGVIR